MGAGKTTLSNYIANDFNGRLILEEFEPDKNPFLAKFYENPDKYAFQVEMTFLAQDTVILQQDKALAGYVQRLKPVLFGAKY